MDRLLGYLSTSLEPVYGFRSLLNFKHKFNRSCARCSRLFQTEPRYLASAQHSCRLTLAPSPFGRPPPSFAAGTERVPPTSTGLPSAADRRCGPP